MRADFSPKTKRLVAERAGYRCSILECNKLTIGPSANPAESRKTGTASHIYGAALSGGGPRGTGGLSKDELQSPQNAIWLCTHHANLIDKGQGADYSAETLHSFKSLHETRIAREISGVHAPFNWVHKFTIDSCPLFSDIFEIEFAKLNLIVGGNSVGKTALCEWISGTSNPTFLERWQTIFPNNLSSRVSTSIDYLDPDPHRIEVDFLSPRYPRYKLDGEEIFLSANTVKIVFPEGIEHTCQQGSSDLEVFVNSMKLHAYEIQALCDELSDNSDLFKGVQFEESVERTIMHLKVRTTSGIENRVLRLLASSERERLMMEIGIIAANKLSMTGPTLFILDANHWLIDNHWLERYAEFLGSPARKFQTVATTRLTETNFDNLRWTGWKVIRLDGPSPDAT